MADAGNNQEGRLEDQAFTPLNVREMQGAWVFDADGEAVGKISDVLVDQQLKPTWMMVSYGAFLRNDRLIPVFDTKAHEHGYVVSYTKDMVHGGPSVSMTNMDDDDEKKLMSYWCTTMSAESPRACTYYGRS